MIWTQLNAWNYGDAPDGYSFIVEMQLNDRPVTGGAGPRARLYRLISDEDRTAHLAIHNQVAVKLRPNPVLLGSGDDYLSEFQKRSSPFDPDEDVWFRYSDEDDLQLWFAFVAQVLPAAIDRFLAAAAAQRGRPPDANDLLW